MTAIELIEHVRAKGGDLRLSDDRLQYRPAGVLSDAELAWLDGHRDLVTQALSASIIEPPSRIDGWLVGRPLGEAGPGVPAWRCSIDRGSGHIRGRRPDGSLHCATCHPCTLELGPGAAR
jgi:hypothetical protein